MEIRTPYIGTPSVGTPSIKTRSAGGSRSKEEVVLVELGEVDDEALLDEDGNPIMVKVGKRHFNEF